MKNDRKEVNRQEKYAADHYNSKSLMEAYNQITAHNDVEFSREIGTRNESSAETHAQSALLYTYSQVMDAYREGTVEGDIEGPKNER